LPKLLMRFVNQHPIQRGFAGLPQGVHGLPALTYGPGGWNFVSKKG